MTLVREVKGCFFTLQGSLRQIRREFRSQVITTNSALECKMACVDSNCRTVSYSLSLQLCYQSELDQSAVPFTQLTEANGDFETYAKGDCVVSQDFRQDEILTGLDGRGFQAYYSPLFPPFRLLPLTASSCPRHMQV